MPFDHSQNFRPNRKGLVWLLDQLAHADRSTCWPWPYATTTGGYGSLMFRYRVDRAHRVAWMLEHGQPLPCDRSVVVMHDCDNAACCNPDHLELGTQSKNIQDAHDRGLIGQARGERSNQSRLTEQHVREIRRRYDRGESQSTLGAEFGISQVAVSFIVRRLTWAHVD